MSMSGEYQSAQSSNQEQRACAMNSPAAGCCTIENVGKLERWASIGAGSALLLSGISHGKGTGLLMSLIGGGLLYRGITGHCYAYESLGIDTADHNEATAVPAGQGVKFEKMVVIHRPASELYQYWRNLENLPKVMDHVKEVRNQGPNRSHWVADGIAGQNVEWDAEIINERENEMISWRSLPGSAVDTAGSVHFRSFPEGNGTAVTVSLKYNPPGGKLGASLASLLGSGVEQKIAEDLYRFKKKMESNEMSLSRA